jgi:hypothetical protein
VRFILVHLAVDHGGDTLSIKAKVPAPYVDEPGEPVPVRVTGAIHLFDPAGPRLATSMRLREARRLGRVARQVDGSLA